MEDYEKIIRQISRVYGNVGYPRLWEEVLPNLEIGKPCLALVKGVIDEFLAKQNGRADSRVWGTFSDKQVQDLVKRCEEWEKIRLKSDLRLDEDDTYGVKAIRDAPRRGSSMFDP